MDEAGIILKGGLHLRYSYRARTKAFCPEQASYETYGRNPLVTKRALHPA